MLLACKHFKQHCVGRETFIHTDCKAWKDLNVKLGQREVAGYLMDILEVAPVGVYIRGVLNTVAHAISKMLGEGKAKIAVCRKGRLEVPPELRKELIDKHHSDEYGSHFGGTDYVQSDPKKILLERNGRQHLQAQMCMV